MYKKKSQKFREKLEELYENITDTTITVGERKERDKIIRQGSTGLPGNDKQPDWTLIGTVCFQMLVTFRTNFLDLLDLLFLHFWRIGRVAKLKF